MFDHRERVEGLCAIISHKNPIFLFYGCKANSNLKPLSHLEPHTEIYQLNT